LAGSLYIQQTLNGDILPEITAVKKPGEDSDVYNATYEVDAVFDRPVDTVWKHFIDLGSWVTSHGLENIYGEPRSEGAITKVSFKRVSEFNMPPAHHHYTKIIKMVPRKQYVLKTWSEKGGSYGWDIVAFDDARFIDLGAKTKVVFNLYIQIKCELAERDPASLAKSMEASREGMIANFQRLKGLVEAH
jgi:hypothetical protein